MTIKLPTDYYDDNDHIFEAESLTLKTGLSILVGCNGTGKTTFMKILKDECEDNNIPVFSYDNFYDGGDYAKSNMLWTDNISRLARSLVSSEGENISNNIANVARNIGDFVRKNKSKSKDLVLMFDAIDSGLSIDNIIEIKDFFKFILSHDKDVNLYIVVSANSYEMANGEQCIDITHSKYLDFDNYEEYKGFIMRSREIKNNRYEAQKHT